MKENFEDNEALVNFVTRNNFKSQVEKRLFLGKKYTFILVHFSEHVWNKNCLITLYIEN